MRSFSAVIIASVGLASGAVGVDAVAAAPTLHAGEFCSRDKQAYYHDHGYTCRMASDGRNRLFTYTANRHGKHRHHRRHRHASTGGGTSRLGRTIVFDHVSRRAGCRVRRHLPDSRCSPGAIYTKARRGKVCTPGYSSTVRNMPTSRWNAIFVEYGIHHHSAATFEVDHLVPLELGGSNARANLFAEPAAPVPGFHQKDILENKLHAMVCSGHMALQRAQHLIARNWLKAYRRYVV